MAVTLAERLQTMYLDHMVGAAETIRDWPDAAERMEQAIRHVRQAMYLCSIGKLNQTDESRIFSILAFAMPEPDSSLEDDTLADC